MVLKHDQDIEPRESDELFVAFANTLSHTRGLPQDDLPDGEALLRWLRDQGLISARGRATEAGHMRRDPDEDARRMERFRRLRDVLHDVAADLMRDGEPSDAAVTQLNHILRHGLHYHQLRRGRDGAKYEVSQVGDRLDQARAAIAGSFAHFLAEDAPDRLRVCANEGCRWIFVDRSPAGRRRWCDMRTCGNQAKVARHRARAKARNSGVPVATDRA
ncbi:MAG TPA: CGNR zinc finger domain-containing protein [Candidatus Limnocylindria bacterium]|nr:CGNR zinc finger domain-containing protein [Candidatus Limnocylindria bacterium]